jgi:hypothetical protein
MVIKNVGSSLNNLEIEAKMLKLRLNVEDLEIRVAIFIEKYFNLSSLEVQLQLNLKIWKRTIEA